jgi:hypothetical protein
VSGNQYGQEKLQAMNTPATLRMMSAPPGGGPLAQGAGRFPSAWSGSLIESDSDNEPLSDAGEEKDSELNHFVGDICEN